MKRVGIIGAGAAGIAAALEAARRGATVLLFDSNPRIGRKLMTTGSGRCNLSNGAVSADRYVTTHPQRLAQALERFSQARLIQWLDELGVPTYATEDGWGYPISNAAANVVDIFEARLKQAGVAVHLRTLIQDIQPVRSGFRLIQPDRSQPPFAVETLIVASGGKAYPQFGSRGELLGVIERLGHTILPVYPALAPLLTDRRPLHKLQGVRLDARLQLYGGDDCLDETIGNIIFTAWGINGPGVMDLSHAVGAHQHQPLRLVIDFVHRHEKTLQKLFNQPENQDLPLRILLEAVLPAKVAALFVERAGLPPSITLKELAEKPKQDLLHDLRNAEVAVKGSRGFEFSQASTGGVPLDEIDPTTMQSERQAGLFFAGEVVDVVGPCGGFNLHWAFTSGWLAGHAAGNVGAIPNTQIG